jgi:hypothetical protein
MLTLPLLPRVLASAALLAGMIVANWINPPYPFPYENNLAFADFIQVQQQASRFLAREYAGARIDTAWPLTIELTRPELGYVSTPLQVTELSDMTPSSIRQTDWERTQLLVTFSKRWDGTQNIMHFRPLRSLWERHYGELALTDRQPELTIPMERVAHFEQRGQWVDVYVNSVPATARRESLPIPW